MTTVVQELVGGGGGRQRSMYLWLDAYCCKKSIIIAYTCTFLMAIGLGSSTTTNEFVCVFVVCVWTTTRVCSSYGSNELNLNPAASS